MVDGGTIVIMRTEVGTMMSVLRRVVRATVGWCLNGHICVANDSGDMVGLGRR